jgi:hypothetical protein
MVSVTVRVRVRVRVGVGSSCGGSSTLFDFISAVALVVELPLQRVL